MQQDLFDTSGPKTWQLDKNSQLTLFPELFPEEKARDLFKQLVEHIQWQQSNITIAGRVVPIPRLNAWYGEREAQYQYSGTRFKPLPWLHDLLLIRRRIEQLTRFKSNSVLANLYRNGQDSVAWHADNEQELGSNPTIASVSFGQMRRFQIKHRSKKSIPRIDLDLPHNSLLLMSGELQHHWIHCVPKTRKPCGPRLNLTFRQIVSRRG